MNKNKWTKVVFASDCEPCEMCEEPVCNLCEDHYSDCECPGPSQDDQFEYRELIDGTLEAREF